MKAKKFLEDIEAIKRSRNFERIGIRTDIGTMFADEVKLEGDCILFLIEKRSSLVVDIDRFEELDYKIEIAEKEFIKEYVYVSIDKKTA